MAGRGDAPKRLIWQAIPLSSETLYEAELKGPADREYFWDIATMAVKYDGAAIGAHGPMAECGRWAD